MYCTVLTSVLHCTDLSLPSVKICGVSRHCHQKVVMVTRRQYRSITQRAGPGTPHRDTSGRTDWTWAPARTRPASSGTIRLRCGCGMSENCTATLKKLYLREKSLKLGDGLKRSQILLIFLLWTGAILSALQTSADFTDSPINETKM